MSAVGYPRPYDGISTIHEAVAFLDAAFATQLDDATTQDTKPNEPTAGDARVREAFCALLPPDVQRRFFLRIIGDRRYWPRLRTLIGSPPYSFLLPEDEGVLRASGIRRGRVHMAAADVTATSYAEFGKGHYEDAAGRLYRVVARDAPPAASSKMLLPWIGLASGVRIVADVRVQKRAIQTKLAIAKGRSGPAAQASLVFPRVGDVLTLRLVSVLRNTAVAAAAAAAAPDALRASVQLGRQKAPRSPVARLVLCVQ